MELRSLFDRVCWRAARLGLLRSRSTWDAEYARGRWDRIASDGEAPRFRMVAGLLEAQRARAVLDVGCGVGTLLSHWSAPREGRATYRGIDLSDNALATAKVAHPWAEFERADFDAWSGPGDFDAIVFSDSLYHARSPRRTVGRFFERVREGGSIIVSVFDHAWLRGIWGELDAVAPVSAEREAIADDGRRWLVRVFKR